MSERSFSRPKSSTRLRSRKPVLLLLVEGKFNATETIYFSSFRNSSKYSIKVITTGDTDPLGMLDALKKECDNHDIKEEYGDKSFVVLDLDVNDKKAKDIMSLSVDDQAKFIISNPCFEIWYLNHFEYSTKQYSSSKEVKRYLKKEYVHDYSEKKDMKSILEGKLSTAINNSKQQIKTGINNGYDWPSDDFNPRSDVVELIELIKN